MRYPFKVWGFGEDIALRALQEYSAVTGEPEAAKFVQDLVGHWCARATHLAPADHVAPGVTILELFERTNQPIYLEAARRLGNLYLSFAEVDGIPVHRPDLEGLNATIWVDCLALDGPFLTRLALEEPLDRPLLDLATHTVRAYTSALLDGNAGLFRHGYDVQLRRKSDCNWGRGNGWAMHGLVDTLEVLPQDDPARGELTETLNRQTRAVVAVQDESGLWHTVLDDPRSPLENSTAALFASAILKAARLGLLDVPSIETSAERPLDEILDRTLRALLRVVQADGGLPVSYATPIGDRTTYVDAPLGIFPWGQGPLILTFVEAVRAASDWSTGEATPAGAPQAGEGGRSNTPTRIGSPGPNSGKSARPGGKDG